ncbi:hypothetical protein KVT40_008346 [Elsinoe batatas]|uniref:AB hydrolase-1 domain-containing protein n=1 Tax=Elsinoe batatas TaxID=2601811 RepID=A0A8K0P9F5_9PEZI|nr:hypothetical protein KVT40_008346 [Elsinoe batatas]
MNVLSVIIIGLAASFGIYFFFLSLLIIPYFQTHAIYLHRITQTWGKDVNIPERWGFLHNQVSPFHLQTPDNQTLHAWHILPLDLYRQHESALTLSTSNPTSPIQSRLSFHLLTSDPSALLVLYLHGAGGTLASGHRPQSYRAISALSPSRIHILAIDYRGFGTSTGTPSEAGLLIDALAVADFAMTTAGIPPHRIVVFAQSLGTAVAVALMQALAQREKPVYLAGLVMVAPFSDVRTLTATYSIAKTIPVLGPVARVPVLMEWLQGFIRSKWPTKETLGRFVRGCEEGAEGGRYHVTMIHAKDDFDIPWGHSEELFWWADGVAGNVTRSEEELEEVKRRERRELGAGGFMVERRHRKGVLRQHILEYGLHDWTMGHPAVSMAIWKTFLEQEQYTG